MGLTVKDMMKSNFFKDYRILAGERGLDKQIQGVAILDAPDGYKWTKGKELVISSGYIFHKNPGLWNEFIESDNFKKFSCMGIKERYVNNVPDEVMAKFNECNIPLILIPPDVAWMDIKNSLNVIVMNKDIRQFNMGSIDVNYSDLSYHVRKIERILSQLEKRMGFPAMLYDISNDTAYYSSDSFIKMADKFKPKDFWEHKFPISEEVICDNLKFIRHRYMDDRYEIPYSWLTIPITVMGKVKAYFVVVEATSLIDYFDQFAVRISFLLLQSIFEQFLFFDSVGDFGFEKFINDMIFNNLNDQEKVNNRAIDINIDVSKKYYNVLMQQVEEGFTLSNHKDFVNRALKNSFQYNEIRIAFVNENSVLVMLQVSESERHPVRINRIKNSVEDLKSKLEERFDMTSFRFGICDTPDLIYNIRRNYDRASQAIEIGQLIYPNKFSVSYSDLGALAWIRVDNDELRNMIENIEAMMADSEQQELLDTLKNYLECKMNFSLTAKQMYIHINTVRKRIEKARDLLDLDLDDHVSRLKLELFLILSNKA